MTTHSEKKHTKLNKVTHHTVNIQPHTCWRNPALHWCKKMLSKKIWIRSGTTDELMQYFFQLCLTSAVAKISSHGQFHARYARLERFNKSSSAHVTPLSPVCAHELLGLKSHGHIKSGWSIWGSGDGLGEILGDDSWHSKKFAKTVLETKVFSPSRVWWSHLRWAIRCWLDPAVINEDVSHVLHIYGYLSGTSFPFFSDTSSRCFCSRKPVSDQVFFGGKWNPHKKNK